MEVAAYDPGLDGTSRAARAAEAEREWRERPGQLEARRGAAREGRARAEVWTKEPHGGAYRRAGPGARGGYDALEQRADGSARERELGFERPASGPTTNFVGNHMTQGAIDLVQAQLARRDPRQEEEAWRRYMHTYHPPKRIEAAAGGSGGGGGGGAAPAPPPEREIPRFQWRQRGGEVRVDVPLEEMGDARLEKFAAEVEVEREVAEREALVARVWFGGTPARAFALRRRLWGRLSSGPGAVRWEVHGGSNTLRIRLRKADPKEEWSQLEAPRGGGRGGARAPEPLSLAGAGGGAEEAGAGDQSECAVAPAASVPPPPPDLAALRWAIREGRRTKQKGDGMLYRPLEEYRRREADELKEVPRDRARGDATEGRSSEELAQRGHEAVARGRWDEALELFSAASRELGVGSDATPPAAAAAAAADLHVEMAGCHAQLGAPRAAADVATEAVKLCEVAGGLETTQVRARLRRALALEELERFPEAAADFGWVARAGGAPVRAAQEGLARAGRGVAQARELAGRAEAEAAAAPPPAERRAIPHAGHPQFVPRGKAGAPF